MTQYMRTQLECVELSNDTAGFFVAGRSVEEVVRVALVAIPYEVRNVLAVGKILHAKAEIGVPRGQTVRFDVWESR